MESLFGDMPLPAKFLIAFIVVLALIGGVAYLVRRFGAGGLSSSASRGRQPRLGVIEAAAVDSRRRLVLIRRDNVEHLIMLGGPTDVVVEMNIVRGQPAAPMREPAPIREPAPLREPSRATPAPETMWPLAPEPAARPRPPGPDRIPPLAEELPLQPHVEPAPRAPAPDRLASLAAEFSRSAVRAEPPAPRAPAPELRRPATEPSADERNLTDIAHRLEAALRRPAGAGEPAAKSAEPPVRGPAEAMPAFGARRPTSETRPPVSERSPYAPRTPRSPEPTPPAAEAESARPAEPKEAEAAKEAKPGAPTDQAKPQSEPGEQGDKPAGKTVYESLEQEMASLLGRPTGKS